MALVTYSDSEGSDSEREIQTPQPSTRPQASATTTTTKSNFHVDRSNPSKIKINLQSIANGATNSTHDDEPAAKRPRTGPSAFSGFNSMLPAPKKDNQPAVSDKASAPIRKVFSLKTGAEASFSRDSDAELRHFFAEQESNTGDAQAIPSVIPKPPAFAKPAPPAAAGTAFLFKPLSVSRNVKKKKPTTTAAAAAAKTTTNTSVGAETPRPSQPQSIPEPPPKKMSLFSTYTDVSMPVPAATHGDDIDMGHDEDLDGMDEDVPQDLGYDASGTAQPFASATDSGVQSLDAIASDLNLSAAERRRLFGRNKNGNTLSASSVINFNTDAEYAANQALIAAGDTVQHNPVRAIAPGKHSLRQLMTAATTQKDALEESFAQGKRNKKEAGNKYGW